MSYLRIKPFFTDALLIYAWSYAFLFIASLADVFEANGKESSQTAERLPW